MSAEKKDHLVLLFMFFTVLVGAFLRYGIHVTKVGPYRRPILGPATLTAPPPTSPPPNAATTAVHNAAADIWHGDRRGGAQHLGRRPLGGASCRVRATEDP
jgi:hypothetical protein